MATTGRFPFRARPQFRRTSRTFLILVLETPRRHLESTSVDAKNSAETMSTEGRFNSSLSKSSGWSWETKAGTHMGAMETMHKGCTFPGQASSYLVPNKSRKAKLAAVVLQLQLNCGQWRNDHRRRTLREHVVIGTSSWPKKITRWKELACEQHGQSLAHARGEAGEDVVPLLLLDSCAGDVGLQLSCFQCHSDGEQVLKTAHLKVTQIGRESWVVLLQSRECVHDFGSPL